MTVKEGKHLLLGGRKATWVAHGGGVGIRWHLRRGVGQKEQNVHAGAMRFEASGSKNKKGWLYIKGRTLASFLAEGRY